MEDKHEVDKVDDVMLPGFRFHPTDEELVAFYLRRKILQQSLPIELIRQLDIYKFDPWDLPKLAATGEKEWYFYCPRDRKYRNSARPNRVTGAGFWKATGTDRPIYSSDGTKCVGLKKSLVFYRGRAAKGIKTDWMMHEFRMPSVSDSIPSKKLLDRGIPLNDSWVICRIFKKTTSVAQRALSYPWIAQAHEPAVSPTEPLINQDNTSCTTTELGSTSFTASLDYPFYKLISQTASRGPMISASTRDLQANSLIFPALDMSVSLPKSSIDTSYSSLLLNLSPAFPPNAGKAIDFGGSSNQQMINGFPITSLLDLQGNMAAADGAATNPGGASTRSSTSTGFPFMFPTLSWESPPCPSEMSTGYSSNKCYS